MHKEKVGTICLARFNSIDSIGLMRNRAVLRPRFEAMKLKPIRRSIGAFMLIDGIRAFLAPSACARRLEFGNPYIDDILEYFAENPRLVRGFSLTEITIGIWLALR